MYKRTQSGWMKHIDFMLADLICLQLSFIFAYWVRMRMWNPYVMDLYRTLGIMLSAFFIATTFFDGSYSGILRRGYFKEAVAVLRCNIILLVLMLLYTFVVHTIGAYSRIQITSFFGINCVMMYLTRLLVKWVIRKRSENEKTQENLLLISQRAYLRMRLNQLMQNDFSSVKVTAIAVIDQDMSEESYREVPIVAHTKEQILEYTRTHTVDAVMIEAADETALSLTEIFLRMGIPVHMAVDRLVEHMPNPCIGKINGVRVITTSTQSISPLESVLKRIMDICGGIVGLMITGIAFIFVAPKIKRQAPGPIFFSQKRVGKNGRIFTIYKFRSMYVDAEERKKELMEQNKMKGLMFKMDDDPRIFPFGHTLRNTSIDELPQFWNILKGDMSLVGTRPPTVDEYEQYELHHKSRLAAKPGLTGLWQVSGRSDIIDFEEVVRLDNQYIQNWNLGLDIRIILKTIKVVFKREGSV